MMLGNSFPTVGYGTYLILNEDAEYLCSHALTSGYCHIDTAEIYKNEEGVGKAISKFANSRPFLTTKLWPLINDRCKTFDEVISSFNASLVLLGVDTIDLYLIHAPFGNKESRLIQWEALIHLQSLGKCKHIGVSNYSVAHLNEIKGAGLLMPSVNQIEIHPLCQHKDIVNYCRNEIIVIYAYSSLAPLASWRVNQRSAKMEGDEEPPLIQLLANKYGISKSAVLLLWAVQHGYGILPKSCSCERIKDNLKCIENNIRLSEQDIALLDDLDGDVCYAWPSGDPCKRS